MASDDPRLVVVRRDSSGGQNNRQSGTVIGENQVVVLKNADISVPGETKKRPGLTLVEDLSDNAGYGLFGFEPAGGTNELIAVHGTKLEGWVGSGVFTEHKTDFTTGTVCRMIKVGESGENDVLMVKIDGNNWFRMNQSHSFQDLGSTSGTGTDSPPDSEVALYFRNRMWVLKDNQLYWSAVFSADYSAAFDTVSDAYRIPVGEERTLLGLRDQGIIVIGEDQIWGINPSVTPAATDKPEIILDQGCVAGDTAVQVGDDILFLARDGVRGLFRTQLDKVQGGASFPLSFPLKDEYESINWAQISKATAVYFDNKYFISLPVDASSTNNEVWVYYPAYNSWMVITGWNVSSWAKLRIDGQEKLYAIDSTDGSVYEAWKGFDDNGTAIDFEEQGRKEDLGEPLRSKSAGELKIVSESSGDYDISIYISKDDEDFQLVGTMNLAGNAPVLPFALPVTLAANNRVYTKIPLDAFSPWEVIQYKIQHNDTNGSDDIKIFERSFVAYADQYQSV